MKPMLLITGANGYLGAHCVERFTRSSETEIVATWHSGRHRLLEQPPPHLHYERCDLTDRAEVGALFRRWRIDRVLHAAALLPDDAPSYLARAVVANVTATANLVDSAVEGGSSRFVYCSSISVYGDGPFRESGAQESERIVPSSVYGWTKFAGEECLRIAGGNGGLSGLSLRLAGIHGRGRRTGAVFNMMRCAVTGEPLVIDRPRSRIQILFIHDALDAISSSLTGPLDDGYQCINVASHTFDSLEDMAAGIIEHCGSQSAVRISPASPADTHVMNLERMGRILRVVPRGLESSWDEMRDYMEHE